jgi:Tat protein secretion system quality control protein TatD with DNase activity
MYGRENKYRAQPADIMRSLKAVAALKVTDESAIAQQTTHNAIELFGLSH